MTPAPRVLRVLVADDFADGRELVAEYLTFRGHTVYTAINGRQTIEIARTERPDLVLLDLAMPDIDGLEAARALRNDPRTAAIVLIALTARTLKTETDAAIEAGCDAVVCKPFDLTALGDALPRVITHGVSALDVPGLSLTAEHGRKIRRNESAGS